MRIKTKIILAASVITLSSAFADKDEKLIESNSPLFSMEKFYLRATVGKSFPAKLKENKDKSYNGDFYKHNKPNFFALGIGCYLSDDFRVDISYRKRSPYKFRSSKDLSGSTLVDEDISQKFNNTSYMLNGYYNFWKADSFLPFVSAGIGYAVNKSGPYRVAATYAANGEPFFSQLQGLKSKGPAFDLGLGFDYKLTDNMLFNVEYKYTWMHKFKTSRIIEGKPGTQPTYLRDPVSARFNLQEIGIGLIIKL